MKLTSLKKVWRGFNYWRKKYWFTRTLIIILLFTPLLYEKIRGHLIICDLVKIACEGIFVATLPQYEHALCRFNKFKEKRRLQTSIIDYADKNKNGVLDQNEIVLLSQHGCEVGEIQKKPLDLDLDKLAINADLLGLLPPGYSTSEIRMNAFFAAHAESEYFYNPLKNEVYDLIDRSNWIVPHFTKKQKKMYKLFYGKNLEGPDYTTWKTWEFGISYFIGGLTWIFSPFLFFVYWFAISVLISFTVSMSFLRYKKIIFISTSLIFLLLLVTMRGGYNSYSNSMYPFWNTFSYCCFVFSLTCFSVVSGLTACKILTYVKNKELWRISALFLFGLLMFVRNFDIKNYYRISWYSCLGDMVAPSFT